MIGTKEYYDLMEFFDRTNPHMRRDKEPKELWKKGIVYQDGKVNELFKQFLSGYAYSKAIHQDH